MQSRDKLPLRFYLRRNLHRNVPLRHAKRYRAARGFRTTDNVFPGNNRVQLLRDRLVSFGLRELLLRLQGFSEPRSARHFEAIPTSMSVLTDDLLKPECTSGEFVYSKDLRKTPLFCEFSRPRWRCFPLRLSKGRTHFRSHLNR